MNQKGGRALRSNQTLSCNSVKDGEGKKPKPVREESFSSKLVFEKNDFRYIDKIVDPNRRIEATDLSRPVPCANNDVDGEESIHS